MAPHARKPSFAALVLTLAAGAAALAATGQFRRASGPGKDLATLEKQIAGHPDAATWNAYGDALRDAQRPAAAADAYQRALDLDPANRVTKINLALALAQSQNADAFFAYISRLTMTDAKLAADLFTRPELAPLHADPRFHIAADSAHAQAVD